MPQFPCHPEYLIDGLGFIIFNLWKIYDRMTLWRRKGFVFSLEKEAVPFKMGFGGNGGTGDLAWGPDALVPWWGAESDVLCPLIRQGVPHGENELAMPVQDSGPLPQWLSAGNYFSFCFHLSLGNLGRMGLPLDLSLICGQVTACGLKWSPRT